MTGALLRTLAASKPGGQFLELGTGIGYSTVWILDGMDSASTFISVDIEASQVAPANQILGGIPRFEFVVEDAAVFLTECANQFDLIFAAAWPSKFSHRDQAITLLRPGGFYVVDDLEPQPSWPEDHGPKVKKLSDELNQESLLQWAGTADSTGLMVGARRV